MLDAWRQQLGELRYDESERWVRAYLGDRLVVDSRRALLVWEPRRVVPSYAVPPEDLAATVRAADPEPVPDLPVLHPGVPFAAHSTPGQAFDLVAGDRVRPGAGFRAAELPGHLILDFGAFDRWLEEDEELLAHPHDPYQRLGIRPSRRRVRISRDGVLLAESSRPTIVFETLLPMRFYLPAADVVARLLPSPTVTSCAYKGTATYYSVAGCPDVAWSYPDPLPEARRLAGLVAFYDEKVEVTVDGEVRPRPGGVVADTLRDEFGLD